MTTKRNAKCNTYVTYTKKNTKKHVAEVNQNGKETLLSLHQTPVAVLGVKTVLALSTTRQINNL